MYPKRYLIKLLKLRSIKSEQSVSDYINQALYQDIMEEKEDLEEIQKILNEPTVSYEEVMKQLKIKKK